MTTRPAREHRSGMVTLGGGSAAQWCRDVVRVTRDVHRIDAALEAACATAPPAPRITATPLLGGALAEVVERTERPLPDAAAEHRRRRRSEAVARDLTGPHADDCPSGTRPRPRPVEAPDPVSPPGCAPRPAERPDPGPAPSAPRSPSVPAARLRALAGPDLDACAPGRSPGAADAGRRTPRPAPRTGSSRPAQAVAPVHPSADLAASLASRLASRVGASGPDGLLRLGRARVRATGPATDLLATDLRTLAAPGTADRALDTARERAADTPVEAPRGRRRRPAEPPVGGHRAPPATDGTDSVRDPRAPTDAPAAPDRTPSSPTVVPADVPTDLPTDLQGLRALARYAERPARPPRLGGGPLSDDTEAARGLPWTGTAPVTPDVRAATTAVGLNEPDLELVMTRILDDAARRHGIEV